jgi:hypothetical protein
MLGFSTARNHGRRRFASALVCAFGLAVAPGAVAEPPTGQTVPKQTETDTVSPSPAPAPSSTPPRTPAYVLLAAGGTFALGAIVTGILADIEHAHAKSTCAPRCTDDQLETGRAFTLTSTLFTGTAVVATAVGAVLFFGGGSSYHAAQSFPRIGVGAAPGVFTATTTVRF